MRFIINFLTICNYLAWIFIDVVCWILTGVTLGVIGIFAFIAFSIAWKISGEATLSTKDYFVKTTWERFVVKVKWANTTALIVVGFLIFLFYAFDWCGMKEFLEVEMQQW